MTTLRALVCVCLSFFLLPAQEKVDEHEKRIAALTPEERAYERYRFWATQFPTDQADSGRLDRYKTYLVGRGFPASEADEQIRIIQTRGSRAEVDRWNRILTSENPGFNTKPNEFLTQMAGNRKPGAALDVGMGQGRNAIWLAQQGWDVTGFDPAARAVALAQKTAANLGINIRTEIKGIEEFDFGESRWDLILLSYVGGRDLTGRVQRALKPGGVLIVEAFHEDATKSASIGRGVVFTTGELLRIFPELRVVRYEEPVRKADFGPGMVRVVQYCGVRPD